MLVRTTYIVVNSRMHAHTHTALFFNCFVISAKIVHTQTHKRTNTHTTAAFYLHIFRFSISILSTELSHTENKSKQTEA